jgi:hypothetical protein
MRRANVSITACEFSETSVEEDAQPCKSKIATASFQDCANMETQESAEVGIASGVANS